MSTKQSSQLCRRCEKVTLHQKEVLDAKWGCLFTVLTGTLFLPIWLLWACADESKRYRCQVCGIENRADGVRIRALALVMLAIFVGLPILGVLSDLEDKSKLPDSTTSETSSTSVRMNSDEPNNERVLDVATPSKPLTVSPQTQPAWKRPGPSITQQMSLTDVNLLCGFEGRRTAHLGDRSTYEWSFSNGYVLTVDFTRGKVVKITERNS